jgi:hypothetical protein
MMLLHLGTFGGLSFGVDNNNENESQIENRYHADKMKK